MRNLCWFALAFIWTVYAGLASATSIPSSTVFVYEGCQWGGSGVGTTLDAACAAAGGEAVLGNYACAKTGYSYCMYGTRSNYCPTGYTFNSGTGQCDQDAPPVQCPTAGTVANISGSGEISGGGCLAGVCASVNGCQVGNCSGGSSSGSGADAKYVFKGCTFTGTAADSSVPVAQPYTAPAPTAPTTSADCLAAGQGYITSSSGSVSCVQAKDSAVPVATVKEENLTTTNGGATTAQQVTYSETCGGGDCTVTKTTATTDGTGTTTKTETGDKASFCSANPTASICRTQTECELDPTKVGCMKAGEVTDGDTVGTIQRGVSSISVVSVGPGASTCPADVTLPKGAVFSWQPACNFAEGLRPILLALAWLAAGFIVLGIGRSTE